MLDFSSWLDLPLIWGFLIATAVFLYALLDGFDLGCGILFLFAPSDKCRDRIMNSIAPFWDGNETWLILGGGGMFAAFPVAYAILMPALYLPVIFMLLGLIFRGVAFEFRFKSSEEHRKIWDIAFHAGSLLAAFMQGVILGNFVQGIEVNGRSFAGGPLDWANGFSIVTGLSLIFGYALLGATWLIMKTEDITQSWARGIASYVLVYVGLAMAIVSISMPFIDKRIIELWFSLPNFFYLLPIPLFTALGFVLLWKDLKSSNEVRPFFLTIVLFFLSYLGIGISLYPWIVPFKFTIWEAAAVSTSQSLLLVGVIIFLPIILIYTAYSYYVFRGKTSHERMY
ncbi:MAG: cytochrome d ubiquinol oxidase subunit II [Rickettsiaceae bacterium]|jgi:cytochrome d ubiquinol oxidase subunit II|nr:cytochrome d ubiquinol oxidase subunit II [Rickettsiaceae bacterium]MBU6184063.1 cytochrome d ubiquinol oxidase subunit II [Rickettsiales bacterium]NBU53012.1 cytochrome d ubiquinol oxidase subunit II [Alphaproteobacteria bacterium]NBY35809.1 cytochrome d ubiquinol oxidase subunit II [Alphaproteobacteria bacterium]BBB56838.1 cytochrome D ubiquinol oxidase subunit II [Candidatus Megaera polyxenophila]